MHGCPTSMLTTRCDHPGGDCTHGCAISMLTTQCCNPSSDYVHGSARWWLFGFNAHHAASRKAIGTLQASATSLPQSLPKLAVPQPPNQTKRSPFFLGAVSKLVFYAQSTSMVISGRLWGRQGRKWGRVGVGEGGRTGCDQTLHLRQRCKGGGTGCDQTHYLWQRCKGGGTGCDQTHYLWQRCKGGGTGCDQTLYGRDVRGAGLAVIKPSIYGTDVRGAGLAVTKPTIYGKRCKWGRTGCDQTHYLWQRCKGGRLVGHVQTVSHGQTACTCKITTLWLIIYILTDTSIPPPHPPKKEIQAWVWGKGGEGSKGLETVAKVS